MRNIAFCERGWRAQVELRKAPKGYAVRPAACMSSNGHGPPGGRLPSWEVARGHLLGLASPVTTLQKMSMQMPQPLACWAQRLEYVLADLDVACAAAASDAEQATGDAWKAARRVCAHLHCGRADASAGSALATSAAFGEIDTAAWDAACGAIEQSCNSAEAALFCAMSADTIETVTHKLHESVDWYCKFGRGSEAWVAWALATDTMMSCYEQGWMGPQSVARKVQRGLDLLASETNPSPMQQCLERQLEAWARCYSEASG